ncbi:unnamed protein product, partial [Prunus brigantina]
MSPLTKASVSCHVTHTSTIWHHRLGHPSSARLQLLSKSFPFISSSFDHSYTVCPMAKQTRIPFSLSRTSTSSPFELLHCDIWGPHHVHSHTGARYFLTIVDDFTRCTWVFLMSLKSETQTLLKSFFALVKNQFNATIKTLHTDNGFEFRSLKDFF